MERLPRARRIACHQQDQSDPQPASLFICQGCSRNCISRIGLYSHTRRCTSTNPHGAQLFQRSFHSRIRLTDANTFPSRPLQNIKCKIIIFFLPVSGNRYPDDNFCTFILEPEPRFLRRIKELELEKRSFLVLSLLCAL